MAATMDHVLLKTQSEFNSVTNSPEDFLTIQKTYANKLTKTLKSIYDSLKKADPQSNSTGALPELIVKGFDDEQIWQQLELQNEATVKSLVASVAALVTNRGQLSFQTGNDLNFKAKRAGKKTLEKKKKLTKSPNQSDEKTVGQDGSDDFADADEVDDNDQEEGSDLEFSDIDDNVPDKDDKFFDFTGDSDDDLNFDFGPLGQKSDINDELFDNQESDEDDSTNRNKNKSITKTKKGKKSVTFKDEVEESERITKSSAKTKQKQYKLRSHAAKKGSIVDDRFFKLAELEEFLDQEDKKEERRLRKEQQGKTNDSDSEEEDEEEDIDLFQEIDDDEDLFYDAFFDPPDDIEVENKELGDGEREEEEGSEEEEEEESEEEESEEEEVDSEEDEDKSSRSPGQVQHKRPDLLADSESEGEDLADIIGGKAEKSSFEIRQEKLKTKISKMEEELLSEKPWQLSGEISGVKRPENSLLQENLQFEHTTRLAPEITEETTKTLEDLIKQRIKDKAWDDVERKVKPKDNPFEYKKRVTLDQDKSKLSLSQIYEQEYIKQQQTEEEEKEEPDHAQIKSMMQSLFLRLDALSNFHYTPKQATAEVKIITNQPSISMEEVAPISVTETALLAPEEIQEKSKNEVKGETEKTKTDKQRERKKKKVKQRERQREKEKREKLIEKLNPGLGNKYSKEKALKKLEKESKSGITVVKSDKKERTGLTSSKNFFTQLQDEVVSGIIDKQAKKKRKATQGQENAKKFKL